MIFISYIQRDEAFADFLAEKLISLGVEVFRMPSSVDAGQKWLDSLRNGLTTCDEALGVMSYKAFERPWIPAEWAAFWVPGKRYTPILLGIESDGLWQPIGASQAVHASNSDELEGLLGRLVGSDSTKYDPRIIRAARLISEHHDVQAGAGEQALGRIVRNLPMGADNIDPNDVDLLCDLGQLPQLIQSDCLTECRERKAASDRGGTHDAEALHRSTCLDRALRQPERTPQRSPAVRT